MSKLNRFSSFGFNLFLMVFVVTPGFHSTVAQQQQQQNSASAFNALQCDQFSLRNAEYFSISSRAGSLVTADFNNDSIPDVAAMMPDTNRIAIALGDNQSGFAPARDFIVGTSPQEAAVGDFNRDGELDLAVTTATDNRITIMHGDGQGNFEAGGSYPVGGAPRGVRAADFNRDGWLDLVIANTEAPNLGLSLFLGGPNGMTASSSSPIALNGSPQSIQVADFNNDGNPDIGAVATNSSGSGLPSYVRLFYGNGSGGFTNAVTITLGEMYALATADFNSDGFADFAVYGQPDLKVRIYLNDQNGGFNAPLEIPTSGSTSGLQSTLVAGDLNGDGKVDLALGSFFMLNDGNAGFTVRQNGEIVQGKFVLADFNGDGIIDQASPTDIADVFSTPQSATFAVAYGTGDARFKVPSFIQGVGGTTQMITGDFNNDGRDDIVFGNAGFSFNQLQIAFQNQDGSFNIQRVSIHSGTANNLTIVTAGDFNNDGNLDIATNINWARSIVILTNNGSGQFTASSVTLNNSGFAFNLEYFQPGDFNNDGYTDFITVSQQAYLLVLNNGSGGGFTVQTFVNVGSGFAGTKRIVVGDFNNDGNKDFAVARSNALYPYQGNGTGSFTLANLYPMPLSVSMARGTDLNNDNRTDIVVSTGGNFTVGGAGVSIFIAGATGSFTQTNFTVAGGPSEILFGDLNNDTFKDFIVTNTPNNHLTVFHGSGSGSFTPQTPFIVSYMPTSGVLGNLNQDQKPDLILGGQFSGISRLFYNDTPSAPCLSVNNASVAEGDTGTTNAQLTVSLSAASSSTVSVDYRVVGRSAVLNSDFTNQSGALTFMPGTLTQTVNVPVIGDVKDEIDETFQLVLSNPSGASLTDNIGVVTVLDDDAAPSVSISDASMPEGTGATPTQMIFNLSLSAPTGRKAKVKYSLLNGTAQGGSDFEPHGGTTVFNAEQATQQIVVNLKADAYVEPDETFRVKLAAPSNLTISDDEANATILNDDFGGTVQFSGATYMVSEAESVATITVTRTGGAAAGITVNYSTSDGTATVDSDYLSSTGMISFDAGETSKTFTVPILNDAIDETETETVNLSLTNISGGAVLGTQSSAVLNISDNDPTPFLSIAGGSVSEGNGGTTTVNFTVRLLEVSGLPVSVNFTTADGTATHPSDYSARSGALVFAPGETQKTVSVTVNGDTQVEPDETFFLNLSAPVNAVLQNTQAVATIINDDSVVRRTPFDFDGDGKSDLSVFRPSSGSWYISHSSNNDFLATQFGVNGDLIAPADFDGDGKTDICVFRPSDGVWYRINSATNTFTPVQFGTNGDLPVPGDFDGDGKADLTVYRPSAGSWFRVNSSNDQFVAVQFGVAEDKPLIGDFDGDGKSDLTVFRPSNGTWYRINSATDTFSPAQFGAPGDLPVAADYDGDGKTDLAVYRPSVGDWYIVNSGNSQFTGVHFGVSEDKPAAADFDGDGKADLVVFRPSSGTWYLLRTTAGFTGVQFGASGDIPIPSAFVR